MAFIPMLKCTLTIPHNKNKWNYSLLPNYLKLFEVAFNTVSVLIDIIIESF